MDTKEVNAFLTSVIALGLNKVGIPLQPFQVSHEGWGNFFKEGVKEKRFKKEVSKTSGMLEDLNQACELLVQKASPTSLPTP